MSKASLDNRHRNKDGEISHKHGNTLVRTLRKIYGQSFAGLKKWESTTFRPDRKFVLRLGFIAAGKQKDYRGEDEPVLEFSAKITEAGSSIPSTCISMVQIP